MTIFASLFALVGRFFGKLLTTTLGWASVLLFGRVPQRRQVWLAVLTFGSLAWVAALVGVVAPSLGTVLIAALPLPKWIDRDAVRIAMIVVAVLLPGVLGGVTLLVADPADRPHGRDLVLTVLRGYLLAPTLAATLVILAVAGTARKVSSIVHRRTDAHVAMVVRPGQYDALVSDLEDDLRGAELVDRREAGSIVLTVPARLLARIAGGGIARLVPDRLAVLRGRELSVDVYPSDLALSGAEKAVARARALVSREMRSTHAWFTTSEEAQEVEDRLAELMERHADPRSPEVAEVDRRLTHLSLPQDEWEVLYLRRLQLVADAAGEDLGSAGGSGIGDRYAARSRDASPEGRRARASSDAGSSADPGASASPSASAHASASLSASAHPSGRDRASGGSRPREARPSVATVVGLVTSALVVLDLVLAAVWPERRRRRTRRT